KEAAAGWVMVVLAAEQERARRAPLRPIEIARWVAPYLAITVAWILVHSLAAGPVALPPYVDEALTARRRAAAWVMLPQDASFLWPWYPHASDVPAWLPPSGSPWPTTVGAIVSIAAIAGAIVLGARRSRFAVPCAITLAPLVPSLWVSATRGFVTSGERLMYLPSAGATWLMALGLARLPGRARPWLGGIAGAVLVVGGAIETWRL